MKRTLRFLFLWAACATMLGAPALALGPVDGEFSAVWWDNEWTTTDDGLSSTDDAAAPGYRASVWLRSRYGVRAEMFRSEPGASGAEPNDYKSLDVMWRAFAPADRTFVAVGIGWQQMDLGGLGPGADTSGVRLTFESRLGLTRKVEAFGAGAYFPSLGDASASGVTLADIDGYHAELGISWRVAPAFSIVSGWRTNSLDYQRSPADPAMSPLVETVGGGSGASGPGTRLVGPGSGGGPGCDCDAAVLGATGSAESEGLFLGLNVRF